MKFICAVILGIIISAGVGSNAKAYDSRYENAAMVSLAGLLMSGAAISATYNNTPSIYAHRRPMQDKMPPQALPHQPKFEAMSFSVTPAAGR